MLKADAARKAGERERRALGAFLSSHSWRVADLSTVLHKHGLLVRLFDSAEGAAIYKERLDALMHSMEQSAFGIEFALTSSTLTWASQCRRSTA